ncbi:hypothetical protein BH10ACT1_BH10ACT1_33300 [soil metagenome]
MARHRAPSVCPQPGCIQDQPCPAHTPAPWAGVDDRRPNTLNGRQRQQRTARIIERDHGICHVCNKPGATEADHVIPVAEGGPDTDANLAAIHPRPCHATKTAAEAARGRARTRR